MVHKIYKLANTLSRMWIVANAHTINKGYFCSLSSYRERESSCSLFVYFFLVFFCVFSLSRIIGMKNDRKRRTCFFQQLFLLSAAFYQSISAPLNQIILEFLLNVLCCVWSSFSTTSVSPSCRCATYINGKDLVHANWSYCRARPYNNIKISILYINLFKCVFIFTFWQSGQLFFIFENEVKNAFFLICFVSQSNSHFSHARIQWIYKTREN